MIQSPPEHVLVDPSHHAKGSIGIEQEDEFLGIYTACCNSDPEPRVGLVLTEDTEGQAVLRVTTPCCNALFVERGQSELNVTWSISAWCPNCELEWTKLMFDTEAVLYFDLAVDSVDGQMRWLAGALGVPEDQLKVTVE